MKCIEDEIPFEVPEGWEWCRLSSIANFELGKTLDSAKNTGKYHRYLRSVNVRWNSIDLSDVKEMKFEETELERYKIFPGDLLICEGGEVGRSCVWESDEEIYYQNALHRVRFYENLNPYFYMYMMMSFSFSGKLQEICKGVTIKHLTRTTLLTLLFPVPPTNECTLIAKKILEFEKQISQLDASIVELQSSVENTKAKILDLAIQGKLVQQNPDDEPASILLERIRVEKEELIKAGKIKRDKKESIIFKGEDNSYYEKFRDGAVKCINDEIPFLIPDDWSWCRLKSICEVITDGTHKTPNYTDDGFIFLSSKNVTSGKIDWQNTMYIPENLHNELYSRIAPQINDILLAKNGTTGIAALVERDYIFDIYVSLALIRVINQHVLPEYVLQVIKSPYVQSYFKGSLKGIGVPNLHLEQIRNTLIPIPPLLIQKSIVSALKHFLELMSKVETQLY